MAELQWSNLIPLTYEKIQNISSLAGVYRLSYGPGDGNFYIFYIGRTKNLRRRILNHIGNLEDNLCIKNYIRKYPCRFKFAIIPDEEVRVGTERELIQKFNSKCNFQVTIEH
ncbi:MAG: GIY-YIG nuclease family protein [Candidatus Nealsonbacteria bacterium]